MGGQASPSVYQKLAEEIEKSPEDASKALLTRLGEKNLNDEQLVHYIWALSIAKTPAAVGPIIKLYEQTASTSVKLNCLRALAQIGGKKAEKHLLSVLESSKDENMRFGLLSYLAQMQSEAILPKTEDILHKSPKEYYWQSYFVYGKIGDKAVPFLLKRIDDKDTNVRTHAIGTLGTWLVSLDAAKPLQERFWNEPEAELRSLILGSLPNIVVNQAELKSFCEKVAAKEKDQSLAKLARQIAEATAKTKASVDSAIKGKHASKDAFQQEYDKLFKSMGKKGSYETLEKSSTANDEPALKALRERILQRDSDEAFHDYRKVNRIIVQNRMIAGQEQR